MTGASPQEGKQKADELGDQHSPVTPYEGRRCGEDEDDPARQWDENV